jgi:hypothetical protein
MNKKIAIKQIKDQMEKLQQEKVFLETRIHEKVSDLDFYNHFGYKEQTKNVISYLDITWEQYDRVMRVLKELKRDLKGSKLVR